MSDILNFFALQIGLLAVVLLLHTYMGLHVIRRTLIFSDLVLDQLAAFGALTGITLGIAYGSALSYVASLVAVLLGAGMLALARPRSGVVPREAAIGILYALALVASLLLGDRMSGGATYITKSLTGSLLWATWPLVGITALVYAALGAIHWIYRGTFLALTDQPDQVKRHALWDFLFFATQGVITVLIVPVAGVLLAYAFLMIPAATALLFTKSWKRAIVLGWGLGLGACTVGALCSFWLDLPYGPTLVLALGVVFLASIVVRSTPLVTHTTSEASQ